MEEGRVPVIAILANDDVNMPPPDNFRTTRAKIMRIWCLLVLLCLISILWASDLHKAVSKVGDVLFPNDTVGPLLTSGPWRTSSIPVPVDKGPRMEDAMLRKELELIGNVLIPLPRHIPSLQMKGRRCGRRPKITDIKFSNVHWQMVTTRSEPNSSNIYLYGAYLDSRDRSTRPNARILMVADRHLANRRKPRFCQFWFKNNPTPHFSFITNTQYLWMDEWGIEGRLHPYLTTCALPLKSNGKLLFSNGNERESLPESVSIVEEMCDLAGNDLKLVNNLPDSSSGVVKDFGVCVKGLSLPTQDISKKLVEWIEMMFLLGAQGIHFHAFALNPNVSKVLKFYEEQGRVTVKPISLPGFQPNLPIIRRRYFHTPEYIGKVWRQELIPYNDCFLSNMNKYKYIAALDIDEIILPVRSEGWKELLDVTQKINSQATTYCFQSRLFFDVATATQAASPFMMNRLYIGKNRLCKDQDAGSVDTVSVKCLHNTREVLAIHNHYPRYCLHGNGTEIFCTTDVDPSLAYVHHHREACPQQEKPEGLKYDPTILRFKDRLIARTQDILAQLRV